MPDFSRRSRSAALACILTVCSLYSVNPTSVKAQRLTAPVAPEGSARTIGMGTAVVALGGDAGALPVNPAALGTVGEFGGTDVTIAGGAIKPDFFVAHAFGQANDQAPGAIWGSVLNGPLASEQLIAYTVAGSTRSGMDAGATMRYERWERNGDEGYRLNADFGLRYLTSSGLGIGVSGLNLFHPDPFRNPAARLPTETEVDGGIGYKLSRGSVEADYVYTRDHNYVRFGAEARVYHNFLLRGGFSDKDITAGAGLVHGTDTVSIAVDFQQNQHALLLGGLSSHF